MAENSKIEWTDHTFNPWIGCTKVHAGCTHCYAETLMDHRYGKAQWGPGGTRVLTAPANWKKPIQWNKAAEKAGRIDRVFCASLADVFEDWGDKPVHRHDGTRLFDGDEWATLGSVRDDLFHLWVNTPNLNWLVLTKRPENAINRWPARFDDNDPTFTTLIPCHQDNVWLGTSPCDQATVNKAIPELLKCRSICAGVFLSCEPLLGPLDLTPWLGQIDWVIVGGESGHGFRPMGPEWAASIRDQCQTAGVPVFIKQMAGKGPIPDDLMVREFPEAFQRTLVPTTP